MFTLDAPVVMTTRFLLVALCLVAMATLVTSSRCSQFPNATRAKSLDITASIHVGENIGLIAGIAVFALLIALLFIAVR